MCIGLSKTRLKRITGFLMGHCLLWKHSTNHRLVEDTPCQFCKLSEETPLSLFICLKINQTLFQFNKIKCLSKFSFHYIYLLNISLGTKQFVKGNRTSFKYFFKQCRIGLKYLYDMKASLENLYLIYTHPQCFILSGLSILQAILILRS